MPSVSVIVPVYNVEDYLERCLESLGNQTIKDIEIIVVDDGSSDSSPSILDKYTSIYPNIIAVHVPNGGVSRARNIALEKARGRYVGFVDSDDYVSPVMFETMKKTIEETEADIVQCLSSERGQNHKPLSPVIGRDNIITSYMDRVISASVWDKLYSRSLIGDTRFSGDLKFAEDFEFNAAILIKASKVSFVPEVLYYYTERESSESHRSINSSHLMGFRVYDYLESICPLNNALREREVSESLRFLDSIVGHGEIGKEYEDDLAARIRKNRKFISNNRYLSKAGKLRTRVLLFSPSLYITVVRLYKMMRGKNE